MLRNIGRDIERYVMQEAPIEKASGTLRAANTISPKRRNTIANLHAPLYSVMSLISFIRTQRAHIAPLTGIMPYMYSIGISIP